MGKMLGKLVKLGKTSRNRVNLQRLGIGIIRGCSDSQIYPFSNWPNFSDFAEPLKFEVSQLSGLLPILPDRKVGKLGKIGNRWEYWEIRGELGNWEYSESLESWAN